MAELQTVSAIFSIADVALKFSARLAKFIRDARKAGDSAHALRSKCKALQETLDTISVTYESRPSWKFHPSYKAEALIWRRIRGYLKDGQTTLKDFRRELRSIYPRSKDGQELGWIAKALLQLRLDHRESRVQQFESEIETYMRLLHMSISCITVNSRPFDPWPLSIEPCVSYLKKLPSASSSTEQASISEDCRTLTEEMVREAGGPDYTQGLMDSYTGRDGETSPVDARGHESYLFENDNEDEREEIFDPRLTDAEVADLSTQDRQLLFDDEVASPLLNLVLHKYRISVKEAKDGGDIDLAEKYLLQCLKFFEEVRNRDDCWKERWKQLTDERASTLEELGRRHEAQAIWHQLSYRPRTDPLPSPHRASVQLQDLRLQDMIDSSRWLYRLAQSQVQGEQASNQSVEYFPEGFARESVKLRWKVCVQQNFGFPATRRDLAESLRLLSQIWQWDSETQPAAEVMQRMSDSMTGILDLENLQPHLFFASTTDLTPPISGQRDDGDDGEDINETDEEGLTPLVRAIKYKTLRSVRRKIQRGCDLEKICEDKTPLVHAIESGNLDKIREIAKRVNIDSVASNTSENSATTALHHAIRKGANDVVGMLLALNANPDLVEGSGYTPLMNAVIRNRPEIVRSLLQSGAKADIGLGEEMKTPLHKAAEDGNNDILKIFIEQATRNGELEILESNDSRGRTAMYYAILKYEKKVAQTLLEAGASIPNDEMLAKARPTKRIYLLVEDLRKRSANAPTRTSGESSSVSFTSTQSSQSRISRGLSRLTSLSGTSSRRDRDR